MNVDEFLKHLNLSKADYKYIQKGLKRYPNELELWLFSAMYSEHCGYRHSKKYLASLPRKNAVYFNENAGGIKIGSHAVLFKTESHNHPSAVEPFNGAATGIGGIIRDVLAMNSRPIALADSLKFGDLKENKTKVIFEGVVDGISNYGNCIGVPTLTGECDFDEAYTDNPLVNVMALGIAEIDKIKTAKAAPNKAIVLLGSHTMKDGIGGASFASKDLADKKENRISVQIADPLMEKKLIEAVLEILSKNLAYSCQDCGAAGILSSTCEMAAKGDCGVELYLDKIPTAQKNMEPFEIMLSETQERMMVCSDSSNIKAIEKISAKYEIPFAVIGKTTKDKQYKLLWEDKILADVNAKLLTSAPFVYVKPKKIQRRKIEIESGALCKEKVYEFVSNPNFASKEKIFSQYDYTVGARTSIRPGNKGIGAVWLYEENCHIGIAMESKPRQADIDSYEGTINTIYDCAGKLIAAGFEPLGITNCLNFANPNDGETMYQFTQCIKGMKKALKKLKIPVVSGNVSFYNKTANHVVYPTPTICMIGICKEVQNIIKNSFSLDETVILLGKTPVKNFGGLYFDGRYDVESTDFSFEKKLKKTIEDLNKKNYIECCLRVTKGGIFGALFKGLVNGELGFESAQFLNEKELFSESQGRFLISTKNPVEVIKELNVPFKILGKTTDKGIHLSGLELDKHRLFAIYKNSLEKCAD